MIVTGAESKDGTTVYHIEADENPLDYINQLREMLLGIVWDAEGIPIEYPTQEAVYALSVLNGRGNWRNDEKQLLD